MFPLITLTTQHDELKEYECNTGNSGEEMNFDLNEIQDFRGTTPPPSSFSNRKTFGSELFQYSRLNNKSPSIDDSRADTGIYKITNTDQKLPSINDRNDGNILSVKSKRSFTYVNKNGFANIKIIEANFNEEKDSRKNIIVSLDNQNVPVNALNNSEPSVDPPLLQTNEGQVLHINTSILINEDYVNIKYDHVNSLSLIAILCCWCFPFTGIPALIYTYLMKKYYKMQNMALAKRYLNKAEKLVLITFFFGFTLIAIFFAILQVYFFNVDPTSIVIVSNSTNHKT